MIEQPRNDTQVEQTMGTLLRVGVIASALVVALGGIVYLWQQGTAHPDYQRFHAEPTELRTIDGTFRSMLAFQGSGLVQCGLLMLVATPVARVLLSVFVFARQRDWRYVAVTLFVLGVLFYSLVHGYVEKNG